MRCPMCGSVLDERAQERACRGCPLRALTKGCRLGLLRCPACGYHSLAREFEPIPSGARRLSDLPPGGEARLVGFDGLREGDVRKLLAYGLVPGVRVRVVQKSPAVIVRVGGTELALDAELAAALEVSEG